MKVKLATLIFVVANFSANGQEPIQFAPVDELVNKLVGSSAVTRSLRNLVPVPRSIDLAIQFSFDSAQLSEMSKPLLLNLANAMGNDRLKNTQFRIEGHTDALGTAGYNLRLSERRAQAVVDFLQMADVDSRRLVPMGKGASELLFPDRPAAAENRRVRITALN